ncbi:MAG: toxin TcdB middle/N-terminal domain-containing protein [Pseudomonadota bacterium]
MRAQTGASAEVRSSPGGGGSTRPIGETFEPDLFTGTGNYSVPLWFPNGPGKMRPELALGYSTGRGSDAFGMGWSLPIMHIKRRSDRGLPTFDDASDTFLIDGSELVEVEPGRFRLRREGAFFDVQRLADGWRVRDRIGRIYTLGATPETRVSDPADAARIAEWFVERVEDPHGVAIDYAYRRDGEHLYLEALGYGPYRVVFEYEGRADALTDRRYGFAIRTALRCRQVCYFVDAEPQSFRRYRFDYEECPFTGTSLLTAVHSSGTFAEGETSEPTLRLNYSAFSPSRKLVPMTSSVGAPPPRSLRDDSIELVDLDGDGRPGVLELRASARRYWPNLGDGRWGAPRSLRNLPAPATLDNRAVALADMDGDAAADLLVLDRQPLGYYRGGGGGFTEHVPFSRAPAFDPREGGLRLVDLDGDGIVDLLRSRGRTLYAFPNRGRDGWGQPVRLPELRAGAASRRVDLDDPRVRLADLSGDGLFDLIRVHAGIIEIWRHLGNGRFEDAENLPFDGEPIERFDPNRMFVVDVSGNGLADLVYVDLHRVILWCNRAGTAFSEPIEIKHTPRADPGSIAVADMTGRGNAGVLWSLPWSRRDPENYKYLSLAGEQRPYLLTQIDHGVGLVTDIEYSSSAEQTLLAAQDGSAWQSSLPFPMPVVGSLADHDLVRGTTQRRRFRYFDGFFDAQAREFAGFRRVEATDIGDDAAGSMLTVSTFYQGQREERQELGGDERRALRGRLRTLEVFEDPETEPVRVEHNRYRVAQLGVAPDGVAVYFASLESNELIVGTAAEALRTLTRLVYDDLGNVISKREEYDTPAGTSVLTASMRYTADRARWILALPVERYEQSSEGSLLSWERFYYDGPDFDGLPLGQVARGSLSRHEQLTLTDELVTDVYGAEMPDPIALGLHRMEDAQIGRGWGMNVVAYSRDANGNPRTVRNARGADTQLTYDADGINMTQATNALGHATRVSTDRHTGQIVEIVDPNGLTTAYTYDGVGRLRTVVKPGDTLLAPTVRIERHEEALPFGVRLETRQASGGPDVITMVEYLDGHRERIQARIAAEDGATLVDGWRRYDSRGFEAERTSPFFSAGLEYTPNEGHDGPRRYVLDTDALGRPVAATTPDGAVGRTAYAPGRVTRTDAAGQERIEVFDAKGNLWEIVELSNSPQPLTTRYERDVQGRLQRIVDAKGQVIARYTYDALGRRIEAQHADAGRRRVVHEPLGNPILSLDALGQRAEVTLDVLGRKTAVRVDGTQTETYTYDTGAGHNLIGRLAEVSDEAGRVRLSYDDRGLLASKSRRVTNIAGVQRDLTMTFAYDASERIRQVVYPDGSSVDMGYNERGLLNTVSGLIDSIAYDEFERSTQVAYSNGVVEEHGFDQLTFFEARRTITSPGSALPIYDVEYEHDAVGNVETMRDRATAAGHLPFDRSMTYDARYQLSRAMGSADGSAFDVGYRFDEVGNPVEFGEFGQGTFELTAGTNQLARVRAANGDLVAEFAHDGNGNMTAGPGQTYDYDARGRLSGVTLDSGTRVEMIYGFQGERVAKRVITVQGTTETIYLDDWYEERDGVATRHVVYEGARLASLRPAETRVLHRDHVGTIVLITDQAGGVVHQAAALPFGGSLATSGPPAAIGFIGLPVDDETGLVFAGARYYSPRLGRFITPDLAAVLQPDEMLGVPLHLNPYLYAGNNPLRMIDDNGFWWKWVVGALVIVALVVVTVVVGVATGGAGFAFGILLAASIGSALGAGVGVAAAATSGGDLADGFLFGALLGGAGGAAGYAAGAAVAAAGISGIWGAILAGAAQGAVLGAANGAIVGYGGGTGNWEEILLQAAIGMAIGAVVGGALGAVGYAVPSTSGATEGALVNSNVQGTPSEGFWRGVAQVLDFWEPAAQAGINSIAVPAGFIATSSIATAGTILLVDNWDEFRLWVLDVTGEDEVIVNSPEINLPEF